MSQLDSAPRLSWDGDVSRGKALVVISFFISAFLAIGALIVTTGDGAQAARELVMRFSTLLFICSLLVVPLARLVPAQPLLALAHMSGSLRLSFVATFVFSLACILMPAAVADEALTASSGLYIGLNGLVLLVLLFPASRTATQLLGGASWRAIQLIGTAYFWLSFLISALIHIVRQNDSPWHPIVLTLLLATLVVIVTARLQRETRSIL